MKKIPVGIESIGIYLPSERHSGKYMAQETGIPEDILASKFGLKSKTVPGPDDHTVAMGAKAAKVAMERAGVDPATEIDLVIWAGEVYAERPMQTYGIKLQKETGTTRAWAFDVNQRCGTFIVGMMIAKALMQTENYQRVLIASGYRNSDLIDYKNPRARFMYSLAASGAAMILRANYPQNLVLEAGVISDGRFADDVYVPAGGTCMPISHEALDNRLNYLDVIDPEGLKQRLDAFSMQSFLNVVDTSLQKSGFERKDINYLGLLHMKRSAFEYVAKQLGVNPYKQATYFDEWGHMGQNDGVISLEMGLKRGKIKDGDVVVLTAAGIGWVWNAITIHWGSQA